MARRHFTIISQRVEIKDLLPVTWIRYQKATKGAADPKEAATICKLQLTTPCRKDSLDVPYKSDDGSFAVQRVCWLLSR